MYKYIFSHNTVSQPQAPTHAHAPFLWNEPILHSLGPKEKLIYTLFHTSSPILWFFLVCVPTNFTSLYYSLVCMQRGKVGLHLFCFVKDYWNEYLGYYSKPIQRVSHTGTHLPAGEEKERGSRQRLTIVRNTCRKLFLSHFFLPRPFISQIFLPKLFCF